MKGWFQFWGELHCLGSMRWHGKRREGSRDMGGSALKQTLSNLKLSKSCILLSLATVAAVTYFVHFVVHQHLLPGPSSRIFWSSPLKAGANQTLVLERPTVNERSQQEEENGLHVDDSQQVSYREHGSNETGGFKGRAAGDAPGRASANPEGARENSKLRFFEDVSTKPLGNEDTRSGGQDADAAAAEPSVASAQSHSSGPMDSKASGGLHDDVDILIEAKGSLESRVEAVCTAHALSAIWGVAVVPLWRTAGMDGYRFEDLFFPKDNLLVREEMHSNDFELEIARFEKKEVRFRQCQEPFEVVSDEQLAALSTQDKHRVRGFRIEVTHSMRERRFWIHSKPNWYLQPNTTFNACRLRDEMSGCYASLQPSAAVAALLAEEDVSSIERSIGVYIESPLAEENAPFSGFPIARFMPLSRCPGCSPIDFVNCTTRRVAMAFLRDPSVNVTVAAAHFEFADVAAAAFHPSRRPMRLKATKKRRFVCPPAPERAMRFRSEKTRREMEAAGAKARAEFRRRKQLREGNNKRLLQQQDEQAQQSQQREQQQQEEHPSSSAGRGEGVVAAGGLWHVGEAGAVDGSGVLDLRVGMATENEAGLKSSGRQLRGLEEEGGRHGERKRGAALLCAQMRLAEWFALSRASSFFSLLASPASDFISAQGAAAASWRAAAAPASPGPAAAPAGGVSSFRQLSTCMTAPSQLHMHRFARQMIVDERLKVIYCFIPKAACTSWKAWLRQQQGAGYPANFSVVHDANLNGLKYLSLDFSEADAIPLVTRRDFFKFTFVRNPFARLLSVYLNKHVAGGKPDNTTRKFWNEQFFARGGLLNRTARPSDDFLSFPDFSRLVEREAKVFRGDMEPHIAPQMNLCGLDKVKFDFVGRFEDLNKDVNFVLSRLRASNNTDAFNFGKSLHATHAADQMRQYYDHASFEAVSRAYSMDMSLPLNGIHYEPPEVFLDAVDSEA